jgi:hypothetical protein
MVLCDEASFFQNMSTARYHFGKLYGRSDEVGLEQAALYNMKAIQSVNSRLSDPAQNTTDGIIGSVLCFLTYNVITLLLMKSLGSDVISI